MNQTLNPFEKLLVNLVDHKIEFITVGGMACAFNGYLRMTEDVDILIKKDSHNIQNLLQFLKNYGEGFGAELVEADFTDEEGAIRVIEDFPIDIFTVMAGHHYDDFIKYKQYMKIENSEVPYLSKEGLILLKSNSYREKDKMDVIQLQMIEDGPEQ